MVIVKRISAKRRCYFLGNPMILEFVSRIRRYSFLMVPILVVYLMLRSKNCRKKCRWMPQDRMTIHSLFTMIPDPQTAHTRPFLLARCRRHCYRWAYKMTEMTRDARTSRISLLNLFQAFLFEFLFHCLASVVLNALLTSI